jgi:hypothetical protein
VSKWRQLDPRTSSSRLAKIHTFEALNLAPSPWIMKAHFLSGLPGCSHTEPQKQPGDGNRSPRLDAWLEEMTRKDSQALTTSKSISKVRLMQGSCSCSFRFLRMLSQIVGDAVRAPSPKLKTTNEAKFDLCEVEISVNQGSGLSLAST